MYKKNATAYEGKRAELKERRLSIFNLRQAAVAEAGAERIKGQQRAAAAPNHLAPFQCLWSDN